MKKILSLLLAMLIASTFFSEITDASAKRRMAVLPFAAAAEVKDEALKSAAGDMVMAAIANSNRYELVEREKLKDVLREQFLGASGVVSEETAAKMGELIGAEYLATGKVTAAGIETQAPGPYSPIPMADVHVYVQLHLKILDATTGKILFSDTALGITSSSHFVDKKGIQVGHVPVASTLYNKALDNAVNELTNKFLQQNGLTGSVLQISGGKVYINRGKEQGVTPGQKIAVYRQDNKQQLTTGKVVTLQEKMCICEVEQANAVKIGDQADFIND